MFYEATITLIPKSDKNTTKKKKRKLESNVFDEYRCKNPQQNVSKPNPTIYKKESYAIIKLKSFQVTRMV